MKALVAYFSAGGVTAKTAKRLAEAIGAVLYEIRPAEPYTPEDLDWRNKQSRTTVEMQDKTCRPELEDIHAPVAEADTVFVGFPIWWYREPSVIDTFLEAYDFTGKKLALFATSGGSGIGREATARAAEITGKDSVPGRLFSSEATAEELKAWAESV